MTPERFGRIRQMMDMRQPDLTICLEEVHKPHNLSAIVRTCDAVGVHQVHAVWPDESMRLSGSTATGSQNWTQLHVHQDIDKAIEILKGQKMQVLATNLSDTAVDFREIDYTRPTAILMGQEKHGISERALELADQDIIIPMVGMVQSLNVSVASALILYEAQRQRENAGMYQQASQLPLEEQTRLLFEGGHPILAKQCRKKGLPYPKLDDEGQVIADEAWWHALRKASV
ncbi:tRNA (guanosine(18)-2'-O)-methyltransferase TrmH [Dongshaea marina]|uniref:tRNA (guanosine(18)-2'-O)-methyltransferase TrmH n=1 Tax=Dongshaea marina TaxID=2047966 RepID=UPI000D3E379B|nr:tRNA (guanosine(18)-2'-O)-methyltransferase TrmH [Dongshaea marina]